MRLEPDLASRRSQVRCDARMIAPMPTFAQASASTAPLSFFRRRLQARAGATPLDEWLVAQANLRGFHGAFGVDRPPPLDADLSLEELVVCLVLPSELVDGRLFKLVLRIIQSGRVDGPRLALLAKRERAAGPLWWLLSQVPSSERTQAVERVLAAIGGPPRGYTPLSYDYSFDRLKRRPGSLRGWTPRDAS